jgi:hypothetical protein
MPGCITHRCAEPLVRVAIGGNGAAQSSVKAMSFTSETGAVIDYFKLGMSDSDVAGAAFRYAVQHTCLEEFTSKAVKLTLARGHNRHAHSPLGWLLCTGQHTYAYLRAARRQVLHDKAAALSSSCHDVVGLVKQLSRCCAMSRMGLQCLCMGVWWCIADGNLQRTNGRRSQILEICCM